jgi:CDP-paratose 2-epimerase
VRDNIHSYDVARFIEEFIAAPRCGEVYNLGGGRRNSCSILEAFEIAASISGKQMIYDYVDNSREGDHICYISDLTKCTTHYPGWWITKSLTDIFSETFESWRRRSA